MLLYANFTSTPLVEAYLHLKQGKKVRVVHKLHTTFNKHRFIVALSSIKIPYTHFFLSTGLLLRYFQQKKSIKKNKAMKLLMARFLRKILISLKLKNILIKVRGVPLHLDAFLLMLFRPLSHVFTDPLTGKTVDETVGAKYKLNLYKMYFSHIKAFGYQKTRKKGRVKRKIRRKLVKLNNVID